MSMPEQSGDSFDFCVLFRVYFTGKGAHPELAQGVRHPAEGNRAAEPPGTPSAGSGGGK